MRFLAIVGLLLFAGCEGEAVTPIEAGPPAQLVVISGQAQVGIVAELLPDTLVAKILDAAGLPVANAVISWVGDGQPFAAATSTSVLGETRNRWTLSAKAGSQRLEARWINPATGEMKVLATFTATANAGSPAARAKISGNLQSGTVGQSLPTGLAVQVNDHHGNPVNNATVNWNAQSGTLSNVNSSTNSEGRASATWTLGTTAGAQRVLVTIEGLSADTFHATAAVGALTRLEKVSGDGQSGRIGQTLADPLVVRATDQYGNPTPGIVAGGAAGNLLWIAEGRDSIASTFNGAGVSTRTWQLSGTVGLQTVLATAPGGQSVTFTATATRE